MVSPAPGTMLEHSSCLLTIFANEGAEPQKSNLLFKVRVCLLPDGTASGRVPVSLPLHSNPCPHFIAFSEFLVSLGLSVLYAPTIQDC